MRLAAGRAPPGGAPPGGGGAGGAAAVGAAGAAGLQAVGRDELAPGDLVFFNTLKRRFSHVGIYVGDGKFVHAPRTGARVRVEDLRQGYWARRYNGARRAEPVAAAAPAAVATPAGG